MPTTPWATPRHAVAATSLLKSLHPSPPKSFFSLNLLSPIWSKERALMNEGERKHSSPPPVTLPEGPNVELLHLDGAALHLACGRAFSLIRRGAFSLLSSRKPSSQLSFLSCAVGDFHWPLSSDSFVIRLSPTRFSFSFPTFLYLIILPDHFPDHHYSKLISVLQFFCNFKDLHDCQNNMKMGMTVSTSPPPYPVKQRALRVSAATKLISRVLVQEAVDPGRHLEVTGSGGAPPHYVVAGVRAVADVVDAVEAAAAAPLMASSPSWRFSPAGLALVLRAISAMTARNGGAAITRGIQSCHTQRASRCSFNEAGEDVVKVGEP